MSSVCQKFFISVLTFGAYELTNIVANKLWADNRQDDIRGPIPVETIRVGLVIPLEYLLSKYFERPIRITSYNHNNYN
tara:strand:- start:84 stop:317 length:234 start_codon:yes stop_codon:yes gene_type:complete